MPPGTIPPAACADIDNAPKLVVILSNDDAELLRDAFDPDVVPRDSLEVPTECGAGSAVDTWEGPLKPDIAVDA
jgi:hypothetical protein